MTRARALGAPLVQLVGLAGVAWGLGLEETAGLPLALALAAVAWGVHELAPARWKPAVFLALTAVLLGLHFGVDGVGVLVGAVALAEIAVAPVRRSIRIGLLVVAGVGLAALRTRPGVDGAAVAVLASMFVLRVVLVLLDPNAAAAPRLQRWAYFLQWPNVLFPLYPVVDWERWIRPPSVSADVLHRRGIGWIARGFSQLLAYRLVYHLVLPADWEVVDGASLLWWMLGSFLLYVRISGVFHVVAGLLVLFGRDLPRTQNQYFLAASLSDHYRRVNTYWTAYLEQVVFLPAWFALKRRKVRWAPVVAVLPTFAASWALHHWQRAWIVGQVHVTATDTLFWAILGGSVAVNTAWAAGRPAPNPHRRGAWVIHAAKVVGTFATMTLLWSLWKSETFDLWFARLVLLRGAGVWLGLGAVLVGAVGVGVAVQAAWAWAPVQAARARVPVDGWPGVAVGALVVGALVVGLTPLAPGPRWVVAVQDALAGEHLSAGDEYTKTRGYYDDLVPTAVASADQPPPGWTWFRDSAFVRPADPDLPYDLEMVPSTSGLYHGKRFTTNAHGMRDREHPIDEPPGTYRIALLGASPEMGDGVGDGEVFAELAEQRLNQRFGRPGHRWEILNFAVSGRTLDAELVDYRRKARAFRPDLVLLAYHLVDEVRTMTNIRHDIRTGRPAPDEVHGLVAAVREIGSEDAARALLTPLTNVVNRSLYRTLVDEATADGARVGWLWVPMPADQDRPPEEPEWARPATAAGMVPLLLDQAYRGHRSRELEVAPWDDHPNALAHKLLARALVRALADHDTELGLGLGPGNASNQEGPLR